MHFSDTLTSKSMQKQQYQMVSKPRRTTDHVNLHLHYTSESMSDACDHWVIACENSPLLESGHF